MSEWASQWVPIISSGIIAGSVIGFWWKNICKWVRRLTNRKTPDVYEEPKPPDYWPSRRRMELHLERILNGEDPLHPPPPVVPGRDD